MEIGIIVHSLTGNTLSVAERLQERLTADGHEVEIERLQTIGEEKINEAKIENVKLKIYPDPQANDLLIIAGPVRGASASAVLKHYFSEIGQLEGKPALLFVTQAFPFPWMGGNRALKQMAALCEEHGADVIGKGVINWMNPRRERQIEDLMQQVSDMVAKQDRQLK
ncbi:NADPH-dependent FMN reductase [Trichococcus patagoniensis]|uniref:NADPH-dependent FMN reductase n=1 Tax=Trichococcus patagoniensis TaxID=382641 RepID=A0A2T5IM62_9LACT|nr:NAD(P)H-dependent oxidoreductase [Trichococcus patagoniensis]PTQ84909.1 NADPH-dependent FMN reductase [Trichococcus patagoniensis]